MTQLIYIEHEARVMQAYEAFQSGEFTSITACALQYACNRRNLQNRLTGTPSKSDRFPTCRRHTDAQEQVIVDYIIRLDNITCH
jgi:hypothetical protein